MTLFLMMPSVVAAQTAKPQRLAIGRVMRPSAQGAPVPVSGLWIVLHRVGSDNAAPLDSARSSADGRFRISYTPSGAEDALYFVSARYAGIAYFSPPLRADTVRGGDADVIVYDTSTDTTTLRVQGRHFVMSMPRGSRRDIAEVFEIENEGTHTVVARDSLTPIWTTHLPTEAESISVAPGDIGAGAVAFRQGRAELFAPMSPGVRQLVLTYKLPDNAFPVSQPLGRPVSVLEVLLEEPRAEVEGARLSEVAPVSIDGRGFRRFLGQDVAASAVIRVKAPPAIARNQTAMAVLSVAMAVSMLVAFGLWYARRHRLRVTPSVNAARPQSDVERLVAELATLDARFERAPEQGDGRARYERDRAALKDRIARALADEKAPA